MPVPVLDASSQVERLRELLSCDNNHAAQIMPPPSYLRAILYEGNPAMDVTPDIILVYKANIKTSTSSLPLDVRDEINDTVEPDIELGGDPLPAPFCEKDDFDVSASEVKQYQWPKGELNHCPLELQEALSILNQMSSSLFDDILDVWFVVNDGNKNESGVLDISNTMHGIIDEGTSLILKEKQKRRILLGKHASEKCWSRTFIDTQGLCSSESLEMNPQEMTKRHLDVAQMPDCQINVDVLCRYNIHGQRMSPDAPSFSCPSCVSLELKWKKCSVTVPLQEAMAEVLVQAAIGHKSSQAHDLWKQLSVLYKLFDLLVTCWRDKVVPEALPHLDITFEDDQENVLPQDSLPDRIRTLVLGGKHALEAQDANRRMSVAPSLLGRQSIAPGRMSMAPGRMSMAPGRQSIAPGFLGRRSTAPKAHKEPSDCEVKSLMLSEAVEVVAAGLRENADLTDGLFSLLLECKTFRELTNAWNVTFMELIQVRQPFVRPKNSTRAAKLIQGFASGQVESTQDFLGIEGSLYGLELLVELGLEKLTADYLYIFRESQLVGSEELQPPQLVRAGLGVPREKWYASCGEFLGWLAQVHSALELSIPMQNSLPSCVSFTVSKALKYFQSESSPVRSVAHLLAPGGSLQEIKITVTSEHVREHITKTFDWWRMTLKSECGFKKVSSVFLRSHSQPIFPPQLYEDCDILPSDNAESVQYYCAEAVTISHRF